MTHAFFTPIISGILLVSGVSSIQAEGPYDRVALMLLGEACLSVRSQLVSALSKQTGVQQVDPDLVPNHVLIDYARQQLSESELVIMANAVLAGAQCRVEIMKSCITAGPPVLGIDPLGPSDGQAHTH
jgi:hypothetical protein